MWPAVICGFQTYRKSNALTTRLPSHFNAYLCNSGDDADDVMRVTEEAFDDAAAAAAVTVTQLLFTDDESGVLEPH